VGSSPYGPRFFALPWITEPGRFFRQVNHRITGLISLSLRGGIVVGYALHYLEWNDIPGGSFKRGGDLLIIKVCCPLTRKSGINGMARLFWTR
jgi:hypothetical protein